MHYCVILGELALFNLKEERLINLNVLELFAGVGGFRVGLEKVSPRFKTLWSNQFESSRKSQDAFKVYNYNFSDSENWVSDTRRKFFMWNTLIIEVVENLCRYMADNLDWGGVMWKNKFTIGAKRFT